MKAKKILFPTNFSDASDRAAIYALHLARSMGACISTLHVYENISLAAAHMSNTLSDIVEHSHLETLQTYQDVAKVMREAADKLGFADVEIDHVMKSGERVLSTILKYEGLKEPDLIIMGFSAPDWIKKNFTGSVPSEVMTNAKVPVLVVPEKAKIDGKIDHVAFATTFRPIDQKALDTLIEIFGPYNTQIHCLHITKKGEDTSPSDLEVWQEKYQSNDNISFVIKESPSIRRGIMDYLNTNDIDILSTVTRRRNMIQELFDHSLTKKLYYHLNYPILTFQEHSLKS